MILTTCLVALASTPLVTNEPVGLANAPENSPVIATSAAPWALWSRGDSRYMDSEGRFADSDGSYAGSGSKAASAPEKPEFERVELKTRDKQTVKAACYVPRKKSKAPAAILIHDAGSQGEVLMELADDLRRKGFVVLVPDLRGHGESVTAECKWSAITDPELQSRTWSYAMRDLDASTEYLRGLDNVHNANLTVVGIGAGAVLAAKYASSDVNVRAVALVAPKPEAYGFNLLKDINELKGLPVLLMSTDEGRADAERIQNATTDANDGQQCVDLKALKPKTEGDIFSDKRLNVEIRNFLSGEAMPKR